MKYIEGIDYWVRYAQFPNMASESVVASHGDGTFTIYINTLFSQERQEDRLQHEIQHLIDEHFYRDDLSIIQIEHQADRLDTPAEVRILPGTNPPISVFRSSALPEWASFGFYVLDNSMKPYFEKDQLLYCDDQQLRPGDVGLFRYHGTTMCRQYHKDVFGMTYLFELDRKRRFEDIVLRSCEEKDLICLGRVRTEKRIPLPGL